MTKWTGGVARVVKKHKTIRRRTRYIYYRVL